MKNKLTFLGVGHSESLEHFNPTILIENNRGRLLIDCGHTTKHALADAGLTIGDIDAIFITHVHGDHVFGLERFAFESRFKFGKKPRLIFHESIKHELWDQTLKGSLGYVGEGKAEFEDFFDLTPLSSLKFSEIGLNFSIFPVNHTPNKNTYGLIVENKILYTSDTVAIPELLSDSEFDTYIHDVTLSEWNPVHATLASIIEKYSIDLRKKMLLISYEDTWRDYEQLVNEEFLGFAKQGMELHF
jgi:glyoxylase-like metal-dependent hydrolase (beta-lactamase superfamily II)